jgi:hypothetical protein
MGTHFSPLFYSLMLFNHISYNLKPTKEYLTLGPLTCSWFRTKVWHHAMQAPSVCMLYQLNVTNENSLGALQQKTSLSVEEEIG